MAYTRLVKTGIYTTVSSNQLSLALATLGYAASSEYVSDIIILVTGKKGEKPKKLSDKITLYCGDFGSGYDHSLEDGGYNQIAARNYLLDRFENTEAEWLLMHDADDLYDTRLYDFIATQCFFADAVTCPCFTLKGKSELSVPGDRKVKILGEVIHDPHTRIWRKSLCLRYQKSPGIEQYFANSSRHCGVLFPSEIPSLT